MNEKLLDLQEVSFGYEKDRLILKKISLEAGAADAIGLAGANGVGKSTLLKLLVGLHTGYTGSIKVDGIPVEKDTLPQVRGKIGYVFQDSDSQLFMSTAYEDIAFAPRNYGMDEEEVERRVSRALAMTGIEHLREKQIYKMSGGEKKLVSIATILSMTPQIILMDEPSVALDPKNRRNLIHILNSFQCLKIIASHDLDFILDTCGRTVLLSDGEIVRDGDTREILSDGELLERYGLELPLSMGKAHGTAGPEWNTDKTF